MLKVLIVEDSAILGELFSDYLSLVGYEVVGVARTIVEAVNLTTLHRPNVAVVDYRLGNDEFGTQLRPQISQKSDLAVLYLSGAPLGTLLSREDGEGFAQKPISLDDLDQSVRLVWSIKMNGHASGERIPGSFHKLPALAVKGATRAP
jgi:DNA-binding NarL/FixJ family response regulator